MTSPIDPSTLSCLPIAYAIGGEFIVLDHHAGQVEVRNVAALATQGTAFAAAGDYTSRGMTEPATVPVISAGVEEEV